MQINTNTTELAANISNQILCVLNVRLLINNDSALANDDIYLLQ